jgi:hypothetical protein
MIRPLLNLVFSIRMKVFCLGLLVPILGFKAYRRDEVYRDANEDDEEKRDTLGRPLLEITTLRVCWMTKQTNSIRRTGETEPRRRKQPCPEEQMCPCSKKSLVSLNYRACPSWDEHCHGLTLGKSQQVVPTQLRICIRSAEFPATVLKSATQQSRTGAAGGRVMPTRWAINQSVKSTNGRKRRNCSRYENSL